MSSLKISLPPHLREALEPLTDVLPPELSAIVIEALNSTEIKYDTLADVSKWAFTEDGENSLKKKSLNQRDYDRVSLLAGTITGPSKLLPPPEPKPEPWEIAQDEKNTRRAIAALGDITAAPESDIPPMSNADSKEVDSGPIRRRVVTVDGGGDELVAAGKRGDDE
ncbi:hypothetical protein FS842_007842 [Serendipita sp. 407]|nr:hypothetical protein FS842_007842 [Serendipita sp. 407]